MSDYHDKYYRVSPRGAFLSRKSVVYNRDYVVRANGEIYRYATRELVADRIDPEAVPELLKTGYIHEMEETQEGDFIPGGDVTPFEKVSRGEASIDAKELETKSTSTSPPRQPEASASVQERLWSMNPSDLKGKHLKALNLIAAGHDDEAPTFKTRDEAVEFMTQGWGTVPGTGDGSAVVED